VNRLIRLFTNHRILTNWLMLLIFIAGTFGLMNIKKRIWPAIEFDWISISIAWPGASAREVEDGIVMKVEDRLAGLEGVVSVMATSYDGSAYFGLETTSTVDKRDLTDEIERIFDSINDYPEDARPPRIERETEWARVMLLFIYGEDDQDPSILEDVADEFRDDLLKSGQASEIREWGFPREEIVVELDPAAQQRLGIGLDRLAEVIRASNLDASAGSVLTTREQVRIRNYDKELAADRIAAIPVTTTTTGRIVTVGDVAGVRRQRSENALYTRVNGRNAIGLQIMYNESEDVIELGRLADEKVAEYNARYEGLIHFVPGIRDVDELDRRLGTLTASGAMGLALVLFILGLLLNIRLSFWVAMGIPISFFGLLFLEWVLGITINEMTLFGMIIVIGILVDDGIVIGENIYRHWKELGKERVQAAVDGTMEVLVPVCVSIATTMLAFAPYFFIHGDMGKYTSQIGLVVIVSLGFSLVEALILLPAHLAHSNALSDARPHPLRERIERVQERFIRGWYRPFLARSLDNRPVVIAALLATVIVLVGAFAGNHIRAEFFPEVESQYVYVEATFPAGTPATEMERVRLRMEEQVLAFGERYARPRLGYDNGIVNHLSWQDGDSLIVYLLLIPNEERDFSVKAFGRELNRSITGFPELESLVIGEDGVFGGDPISIRFLGKDPGQLRMAADLFKERIGHIDGVTDIRDDLPLGAREYVFSVTDRGRALGLTETDISHQVSSAFGGLEVMTLQDGSRSIPLMVRYPRRDRDSLRRLEEAPIMTPTGAFVPLREVADFSLQRSLRRIARQDGYRSIRVSASLDTTRNDVNVVNRQINEEILPDVLAHVDGVSLSRSGQAQEVDRMVRSMIFSLVTALLFMFTILVFQMKSYGQALTVLALIPLGVIGATIGHAIIGIPMSFISFLGCIALAGIIVNDSVVMIDTYNRMLQAAPDRPREAVIDAATQRFRAIVMTTVTTAGGVAPLIFQKGEGGQLLVPIAVSIAFGLLFGTFLTLVVLPTILSILTDVRRWTERRSLRLRAVAVRSR